MGKTLRNQNCIKKEIKKRLHSRSACYHSVHNPSFLPVSHLSHNYYNTKLQFCLFPDLTTRIEQYKNWRQQVYSYIVYQNLYLVRSPLIYIPSLKWICCSFYVPQFPIRLKHRGFSFPRRCSRDLRSWRIWSRATGFPKLRGKVLVWFSRIEMSNTQSETTTFSRNVRTGVPCKTTSFIHS